MAERYDEAEAVVASDILTASKRPSTSGSVRNDGILVAQQVQTVKRKIYELEIPQLTGLQLVPVSNEVPATSDSYVTRTFTGTGIAKFIANYSDDLPRADVDGEQKTARLKDIGVAYGYSDRELAQSAAFGTALPERKGRNARRAFDELINRVAIKGDTLHGFYGISNHPNVGVTAIHGMWDDAATTPSQILADLDALLDAVESQSFDHHHANVLAIGRKARTALRNKRLAVTDGSTEIKGSSVLKAFMNDHPEVTVIVVNELDDVDGKSVAIAYERDIDNLSIEIPRDFDQLPGERRNLELVINCVGTCGGVDIHRPLAFTKALGVLK